LQSYLAEPARVLSYDDVKRQHGGYAIAIPTTASADDPCFLQFTSGSTGRPRAVTVTHGNVLANTEATHRLLGTDPSEEIGVNWVPLYHDMGFVATLLAPTLGLGRHVFIPTSFFATRPRIWLETVHRYRGTMTTSNNFGLRIAAKRPPRIPDLDLSCVRALIVGSEPIKVDVLRTFEATYRAHGFDSRALCPAYGMAEATLVISMSPADETYSTAAISDGGEVVSCGRVLPGHEVMVLDDQGASGSTGIGELAYRGPSVTPGYWESSTGSTRTDGPRWLRTGDLGFVRDGQLYVCGRAKDVIIIGGRNYHPQAIEWCAEAVSGVQPDGVIAAAIPGETSDRVVIVAEVAGDTDLDATRRDIAWSIKNSFGFSPEAVCLIERWSLPRTTSGKRRRSDVAKAYLAGGLKQLARSGGHDERI